MAKSYIGKTFTIKQGTKVTRLGTTRTRKGTTQVTVRKQEIARGGKTRLFWKSNGYKATTLI